MTWFRIDDTFADHPKVLTLKAESRVWKGALSLWTLGGAWCARHLTDGFVPASVVSHLGGTPCEARALVSVGLWTIGDGGYHYHEWLERNPPRSEVEAKREAKRADDRERQRNSRANRAAKAAVTEMSRCDSHSDDVTVTVGHEPTSQAVTLLPSRPVPSQEEIEDRIEAGASCLSLVEPEPKRKKRKAPATDDPEIVEVFEHWRAVMGKTQAAVLDAERAGRIRWAITTYGIDFAKRAIDGCAANEWNRGANPGGKRYDDVTLIFRSASKAEQYAGNASHSAGPSRNIATADTVDVAAIARDIAARNARLRSA